ncbi:MAG: hypothetical protein L0H83_14215 [Salinisphaera sp.]|nr:hypothetical protein [Salinisphaera sp.]
MTQREMQTLANGFTYTEGARWHDGKLWFVDFCINHRAVLAATVDVPHAQPP